MRKLGHRLRDPLNGARLHLTLARQLLEDVSPPEEVTEALKAVDLEIDRAAELIKTHLSSTTKPEAVRVSVRALCTRVVRLAASGHEDETDIQVLADDDTDDLEVDLDLSRMERVLLDLLHRATESSLRNGGKVLLSVRRDGDTALVEVQHRDGQPELFDYGKGFDSGNVDDVGLSSAFKAVAEHGGSLEVGGTPERTTFHIRLPIRTEGSTAPRQIEERAL